MVSKIDNISIPNLGRGYNEEEADRAIQNYIDELSGLNSSPNASDILDFFPLLQNAIKTREEHDWLDNRVPDSEKKRLLLLEDDPPEEIDTESITWKMKARVPGRFDQGPAGQGRIKEVMGHPRSVINHPEHPSEKLVTMGKFYGNWIQFNVYARDKRQALRRLLWLERVIDSFHWYFRLYGFRVIEEGCGDREEVTVKDLKLIKYPLTYFIRSDDTYHITTQELKKVFVTTNVSTS